MVPTVCGWDLNISIGRLSRPLVLFDFKCLIAVFISFTVGASEGIFNVSGGICEVVVPFCEGGAARLLLKYL